MGETTRQQITHENNGAPVGVEGSGYALCGHCNLHTGPWVRRRSRRCPLTQGRQIRLPAARGASGRR